MSSQASARMTKQAMHAKRAPKGGQRRVEICIEEQFLDGSMVFFFVWYIRIRVEYSKERIKSDDFFCFDL